MSLSSVARSFTISTICNLDSGYWTGDIPFLTGSWQCVIGPNTDFGVKSYSLCFFCRDDILQAIKQLKVLGSGFALIPVKGSYIVQAVPGEITLDHTTVLRQAEVRVPVNRVRLK